MTAERIVSIRARLAKSSPFSPDRADLEWALRELERHTLTKCPECDGMGGEYAYGGLGWRECYRCWGNWPECKPTEDVR